MKKIIITILLLLSATCNADTIAFVVSASAGGPNDSVTRKVIKELEEKTNLRFVVLNKPGAAHVIAYDYVLKTNRPTLILETPEIKDHEVFSYVDEMYTLGHFTNIMFVSQKSGIKSLKQLIDLSKKRQINFGHGGIGSYSYLAMLKMCKTTLDCLDVPYKSAIEGMTALLTDTIDAYAVASYGSKPFLENENYVSIYNIKLGNEKSWFKLFGKNLSESDKRQIIDVLKSQDKDFYINMGFEK